MKVRFLISEMYPAFRGRNYRLYVYGQFISFAGTWLQIVALGWLVHEITNSAAWTSFIFAFPFLVSVIFLPFGGIIADRFDKRKVLYLTQTLAMIQAFILGWLAISHNASLPIITGLSFMLGIINAVDGPTRNSFVAEIVQAEEIGSATAFNAALITAAQVLGPGIAGFLILWFGIGGTFVINGLTFIAVLATLFSMVIENRELQKMPGHPLMLFWEGVRYTKNNSRVFLCALLAGTITLFAYSFRGILPAITKDLFRAGPNVLGYLGSAAGLGACAGSLIVSGSLKRKRNLPFFRYVIGGNLITGISLTTFSFISSLYFGLILLFLAGVGFTLSFSTVRAESMVITEESMRGRVVGITMMTFFIGMSTGNFLAGYLADEFGIGFSMGTNGLALLILAAVMHIFGKKQ